MKKFILTLTIFNFLIIISFSQHENLKEVYNESNNILFEDYRLFMIYARDSIMLELLSTQLDDFCNFCSSENSNKPIRLNWKIKINLNHEEILDILTNLASYDRGKYFNFLIKKDNKYFIDPKYLNYRLSRKDIKSINIYPDFSKDTLLVKNADLNFGSNNNWNKNLIQQRINHLLTEDQIIAYQDWIEKIGIERTKKITKNKIIK